MRHLHRLLLAVVCAAVALIGAGCQTDANEQFIQGYWMYSDPHLGSVVSEKGQETVWAFDRGSFRMDACCMFEQHLSGRYRIFESQDDVLVLELFSLNGNLRSETVQVRIVVDRENDTARIQRAGPFTRVSP